LTKNKQNEPKLFWSGALGFELKKKTRKTYKTSSKGFERKSKAIQLHQINVKQSVDMECVNDEQAYFPNQICVEHYSKLLNSNSGSM